VISKTFFFDLQQDDAETRLLYHTSKSSVIQGKIEKFLKIFVSFRVFSLLKMGWGVSPRRVFRVFRGQKWCDFARHKKAVAMSNGDNKPLRSSYFLQGFLLQDAAAFLQGAAALAKPDFS
jgi:hypothetical protein